MLNIKRKEDCKYDLLSLGEVMLRLDPGEMRIRSTRQFKVWEGGGEYNVARSMHKCFGKQTGILTALVKNDIGLLVEDLINQGGTDASMICWTGNAIDGKALRNGLNFTERGYGIRGAVGISDRKNTAASAITQDSFDWEGIFGSIGARWLHTGGIFAALSSDTSKAIIKAVKTAKKYGTIISYDLNYRPSLWDDNGGKEHAQKVNREIAEYVDVMIGNEEDFSACLGFETAEKSGNFTDLNIDDYAEMMGKVSKEYPNLAVIATTLRTVRSASFNDWTALAYSDGKVYQAANYENLEILDRIGGGDSFAAGLIYSLLSDKDMQYAVNCGVAHGALAMTTPGDTSMVTLNEVERLMQGGGARVVR